MRYRNHRRIYSLIAAMSACALLFAILSSSVYAYLAGSKWQNTQFWYYSGDTNIDSSLTAGASNTIEPAAALWNTGRFQLVRVYPFTGNGNFVSSANFDYSQPCPIINPKNVFAVNCIAADPTTMYQNRIFLNSSSNYIWDTSGQTDCTYPRLADVQTIVLHELGHSFSLGDNPPGHADAVMNFQCGVFKPNLRPDDQEGIALLYGARTNWEANFATGVVNRVAYARTVAGYFNSSSPPPELGPRPAEYGVTPYGGAGMEVLDGYAQTGYSYAYHDLFTYQDDSNTAHNYLVIRPGMRLVWIQYNLQQSTIGADLQLVDQYGNHTNLRDSGITDSAGIGVHPAARGAYGAGHWFGTSIKLY